MLLLTIILSAAHPHVAHDPQPKLRSESVVVKMADTGEILMLAWMNAEALKRTVESGHAHYFSRSRNALWKKGETSGQLQIVTELRVDCDQDAVLIKVRPQGDGGACHVGFRSCFYRVLDEGKLVERG